MSVVKKYCKITYHVYNSCLLRIGQSDRTRAFLRLSLTSVLYDFKCAVNSSNKDLSSPKYYNIIKQLYATNKKR